MARSRQKIVPYDVRIQARIDVAKIITKLSKHIKNPKKTPLLQTQLHAARILLNKVIPDVKALEIKEVDPDNRDPNKISNEQLRAYLDANTTLIEGTAIRTVTPKQAAVSR